MSKENVKVYVTLLDEGTDTIRPTMAEWIRGDVYKLLPTADYNPENETWEFVPGSIVRCAITNNYKNKNLLLAIELSNQII